MAQLTCNALKLGYEGRTVAENVSFSVEKGNYLCILGENGSGKSTLMKAILGLHHQLDGDVIFGDGLKRNQIGYLPQQSDIQKDFPASVWEIVLSGCLNRCGLKPFYSKAQKETAKANIKKMKIEQFAKRCYRELSGGQQQRVLLARALCATEDILLLDEPVSGLDPMVTQDMYDLIKELNDQKISVIMISHDIEASLRYASHILYMGSDFFFGTKDAYVAHMREKGGDRNA